MSTKYMVVATIDGQYRFILSHSGRKGDAVKKMMDYYTAVSKYVDTSTWNMRLYGARARKPCGHLTSVEAVLKCGRKA